MLIGRASPDIHMSSLTISSQTVALLLETEMEREGGFFCWQNLLVTALFGVKEVEEWASHCTLEPCWAQACSSWD